MYYHFTERIRELDT